MRAGGLDDHGDGEAAFAGSASNRKLTTRIDCCRRTAAGYEAYFVPRSRRGRLDDFQRTAPRAGRTDHGRQDLIGQSGRRPGQPPIGSPGWSRLGVDERGPAALFRGEFTLAGDIVGARLYVTAHGIYEAEINGGPGAGTPFAPG
jgi:hypothetical protein